MVRLLGEGADPNDQNHFGQTAVHYANNKHQSLDIILKEKNIDST